jgi:hypothetical protein
MQSSVSRIGKDYAGRSRVGDRRIVLVSRQGRMQRPERRKNLEIMQVGQR